MPTQDTNIAPERIPVLAIILVSYLMIVLDISIVITALPKIQRELGLSTAELSWVQSAYTLTFGGLLVLGARAGDILGQRRMFLIGLNLFTLASLAVGSAQSAGWIIAARAVQGVGSAILAPATLSLLQANFPAGPERTRAVAYYGAVAGVAASIGLVLGGILADTLTWRVGFFVNLPIGVGLWLATRRLVVETARHQGQFDLLGALTSTLAMTALVYGLVHSEDAGWRTFATWGSMLIGVVLLAVFVLNEQRARAPIMPLRLFADPERVAAYASRVLFLGAMMGFWFFITQFLQIVLGFSPFQASLGFLPMTVANFVVAMAVPRLTSRLGNGRLLAAGLVTTLIGMLWLSYLSTDAGYVAGIALPMVLIGMGQGASLSPLTASGIVRIAKDQAGAASGVVNVAHQVGGSLGLGILIAIFAAAGSNSAEPHALLAERIGTSLLAGAGMLLLALVLVLLMIVRPQMAVRPAEAG